MGSNKFGMVSGWLLEFEIQVAIDIENGKVNEVDYVGFLLGFRELFS